MPKRKKTASDGQDNKPKRYVTRRSKTTPTTNKDSSDSDDNNEDISLAMYQSRHTLQPATLKVPDLNAPSTSSAVQAQSLGYVDSSSVGFTTQENPTSQPNQLHYGWNVRPNDSNYDLPISRKNRILYRAVGQQKRLNDFQERLPNPVQNMNESEISAFNTNRISNISTPNPKYTGNEISSALNSSNVPSSEVSYRDISHNKHLLSHLNRPLSASNSMVPTTSFLPPFPNIHPGTMNSLKYCGGVLSHPNTRPQHHDMTSTICPSRRNLISSKYQPPHPTSERGIIQPNHSRSCISLPSHLYFNGRALQYNSFNFNNNMSGSNKMLKISENSVFPTTPQHHGRSLQMDMEPGALNTTSSTSALNSTPLTSRGPFSHGYSKQSTNHAYTSRMWPTPFHQNNGIPFIPLIGSNQYPTEIYVPSTNPNLSRLQTDEGSRFTDQAHQKPIPPNSYCNTYFDQRRCVRPIVHYPRTSALHTNTPLSNSFQTCSNSPFLQTPNTASPRFILPLPNNSTYKYSTNEFGCKSTDAAQCKMTTNCNTQSSILPYDLTIHQQPPKELPAAVIPTLSADQPRDAPFTNMIPGLQAKLDTNNQTIHRAQCETPILHSDSIPSVEIPLGDFKEDDLAQINANNNRETVLKLAPPKSLKERMKEYGDKPICVISLLSDEDDSSSDGSNKLVIDFDRTSSRSPSFH